MWCLIAIKEALSACLGNLIGDGVSFLQNLVTRSIGNLINLENNADALAGEMRRLREIRDDIVREVEIQETCPQVKRTAQVSGWLTRVEELDTDVNTFLTSFHDRTSCLESCSFESVHSNHALGGKAADLLHHVSELVSHKNDFGGALAREAPPDAVVALPTTTANIVGAKETLQTIRDLIRGDAVGVVGIYGMGGIGKTTLLKKINHEFLEGSGNHDFHVIWVTVSSDLNVYKIQEEISFRLGYSRETKSLPKDEDDRVSTLLHALRGKKFLLLLDDVWDKLDFQKIGIPLPGNDIKGKIVFTTRSRKICTNMDAREVEVTTLNEQYSWELFKQKVGARIDLNSSSIRPHAEIVVSKCGGLPLALITIGHAMADATSVDDWEDAIMRLNEAPNEIPGMQNEVFSRLKFSFDKLNDDSLKQCLLYCSLFPEDYEIYPGALIEYWVGEGFLDGELNNGLHRTRARGRDIIKSLKAACLLESVITKDQVTCVMLHDVVRKMAMCLTDGIYENTNMFLANTVGSMDIAHAPDIDKWANARRISLMYNKNAKLPSKIPMCPNLLTLLMPKTNIKQLVLPRGGFIFQSMPSLRVLDLSCTDIEDLPKEIGMLVELQYLNLSDTQIKSLPKELGKLIKLRQLSLQHSNLQRVPSKAITSLSRLRILNLLNTSFKLTWESNTGCNEGEKQLTLEDVECSLGRLEEFGLSISTSSLESLISAEKLSKCTTELKIHWNSDMTTTCLSKSFERLKNLQLLFVQASPHQQWPELRFGVNTQLSRLQSLYLRNVGQGGIIVECPLPRLSDLDICECPGVVDVTWVRLLPCLQDLTVRFSENVEEVVADGGGEEGETSYSFPKLKQMFLIELPKLRSISRCLLLLPSLKKLFVTRCPHLKQLPLGSHSAKKLEEITGYQEWWDALEWDNSSIKSRFLPCFTTWDTPE